MEVDGVVRGVVWDLGNVLIDWDPQAAIAAGVGADEARRFLAAFDFREWNHGPDSGGTWEDAEAWLDAEHPQWSTHGRSYRPHFAKSLLGEVPGSVELVRELHSAGVSQWGLTNWSAELYPHAPARFDFLELLEEVVVSGVEGLAKPDHAVYELLVARTGLPRSSLVFVDDREDNVAAAHACGIRALVFTEAERLRADLNGLGLPV
ncbi:MAG: HAD-IA family hydrolase [Nocardioides sp.]